MDIKLEDGGKYLNGRGIEAWIAGVTRNYPAWVWSVQGNWYERATGRAIGYRNFGTYDDPDWQHYVRDPSPDDLVTKLEGDWRE